MEQGWTSRNEMELGFIVKCEATEEGKEDCPLLPYCVARLNDRTVSGCGIPLADAGLIKFSEVRVQHTVILEQE